jgi:Protein of unknown function (DUF1592)/Protein of unknown function (DUF1588)/Protein of unknown function (DUF1595)/Protein of unknown function (DUF1587)/Protein of unknown function (DUF1585)
MRFDEAPSRRYHAAALLVCAATFCTACSSDADTAQHAAPLPSLGSSAAAPGVPLAGSGAPPGDASLPPSDVGEGVTESAPSAGASSHAPSPSTASTSVSAPGSSASPGAATGGEGAVDAPAPFEPAAGMLRRLTRTQFRNAVRDVFGVEVDTSELDADSWNGDFAVIGAASVVTSQRGVEQYHAAIENAVTAVWGDPTKQAAFIGCTPNESADDVCTRNFVETLGRKAWRRPLQEAEVERIVAVAQNAALELASGFEGVRWATLALFTSPNFLYRSELGSPRTTDGMRFTGYEMASRLAFLLWNSLPDAELLDEAASGALDTRDGVRAAAERMLETPAGREAVGAFAEEYMRLDRIGTQPKDTVLFPEYGPALRAAMVRDMRGAWEAITFDVRGSALELFTTNKAIVNAELARLYGLDATGLDSDTFQALELPVDSPRTGILGKAGFLSQFANQKEGSPTLRGKFIRQALMCTQVPAPPGDVDVVLDDPPQDMPQTKRERLELHRENPTCAGCHSLMDPLGLPFETFDAIGIHRTTELGLPIDPSGELDGQQVSDSRELGLVMSASASVAQCLVRKYYSYAMGFEGRDADSDVLGELQSAFEVSGYRLRDLMLDVVSHEAFSTVALQPDLDDAAL